MLPRMPYTHYDFTDTRPEQATREASSRIEQDENVVRRTSKPRPVRRESMTVLMHSPPVPIPEETTPLTGAENGGLERGNVPRRYGSFVATPPRLAKSPDQGLTPLRLPEPVLSPKTLPPGNDRAGGTSSKKKVTTKPPVPPSDAYHIGPNQTPHKKALTLPRHLFRSNRTASTPQTATASPSPFLRRMFTGTGLSTPQSPDVPLEAYRELDSKQDDFFSFLDTELDKIENFYCTKEDEASNRLQVLRVQLHEMRDRRMEEVLAAQNHGDGDNKDMEDHNLLPNGHSHDHGPGLLKPLEGIISLRPNVGKTTTAMTQLGSPSKPAPKDLDARRDYTKRNDQNQHVPYRSAKRKLKLALQEFYRALELLKAYALLNRTAFRKINKKYDKATNARPTQRYMSEKVNKAHFVNSQLLDSYIVAVEDLYARYFERGNHKVAVGKLRSKMSNSGDHSQVAFRNGIWVAAGIALGIQGMVYGFQHLHYHGNPAVRLQTSFLLQLYGGYFLGVVLFLLFALDCRTWTRNKINYTFVFEFDSRHVLDWRELAELPCFFLFLNGFFIWLNFRRGGEDAMFLYWPVILVGTTLIIMALPLRAIYYRSRKWWGYSNWRLLLAGLYPVEFRDFFLGDMYCSLTYSMGNIELFFCLYAQRWSNPPMCNSTHSRLLGFFAALPAIWRAFQCIRRYYDSRNWFPHLANCGKYTCSILYYMSLSLYRVDKTTPLRGLFIFFATVNATYCSVWDIAMDWSLGNPYATHRFLRDTLGYRRVWWYYVAMVVDPLLRFTWVFYAIFGHETQHSTVVSFIIALAEVVRRGLWAVFRVENEHCTNVGRFRASRDIPLPYSLETSPKESEELTRPASGQSTTGADIERGPSTSSSLRLRKSRTPVPMTPMTRGIRRVGTIINQAHAQDFERRNRVGIVGSSPEQDGIQKHDDSSEEEDEEETCKDDEPDEEEMLQARASLDRTQS
jgi:xenotropic and polytropic retrovirus receptor 1